MCERGVVCLPTGQRPPVCSDVQSPPTLGTAPRWPHPSPRCESRFPDWCENLLSRLSIRHVRHSEPRSPLSKCPDVFARDLCPNTPKPGCGLHFPFQQIHISQMRSGKVSHRDRLRQLDLGWLLAQLASLLACPLFSNFSFQLNTIF